MKKKIIYIGIFFIGICIGTKAQQTATNNDTISALLIHKDTLLDIHHIRKGECANCTITQRDTIQLTFKISGKRTGQKYPLTIPISMDTSRNYINDYPSLETSLLRIDSTDISSAITAYKLADSVYQKDKSKPKPKDTICIKQVILNLKINALTKSQIKKGGNLIRLYDRNVPDSSVNIEFSKKFLDTYIDTTKPSDTTRLKVSLLNAYSFDFNGSLPSNYFGHLNIWFPPTNRRRDKFGINTGIMKINYINYDSTYKLLSQNVLIHPLDSIKAGTPFNREYNEYVIKYQNTGWSLYVQPVYRVFANRVTKIYLHLHGELLINKYSATTTVTNVQTVTDTINSNNIKDTFVTYLPNSHTYNKTFFNGYFGAGATFNIIPYKGCSLFLQPTIGWTTNAPSPSSVTDFNTINPTINSSHSSLFYLMRASFSKDISPAASTFTVGTDVRGFFGHGLPNPLYALYVGLNIDIETFVKTVL